MKSLKNLAGLTLVSLFSISAGLYAGFDIKWWAPLDGFGSGFLRMMLLLIAHIGALLAGLVLLIEDTDEVTDGELTITVGREDGKDIVLLSALGKKLKVDAHEVTSAIEKQLGVPKYLSTSEDRQSQQEKDDES
ncbi:hypothetical protein [Methylophaga sp. OBS4]|uniref:hypothetical protein n=1 Tax=Methylophaga sp. OBS4 TaxID=2991935 RepID=UPI002253D008|nr:hypothetical protein [Methylophaga sp. OBS4]MCX4186729.1 hypothetical protein [Methylophaga sp. OBS4]